MLGEDLDSFPLPASLDRDTQPQGKAANVDSAIPRWERLRHEYPKMSAPTAILKCGFHPILLEVKSEPEEVRGRICIVRINGHPLRALGGRIDCVKADGDFAFEVATECVQREAEPLAGVPVPGPIIIMPGALWAGSVGLEGVGPSVDEEVEVIRHYAGGRFYEKVSHTRLPEIR
jgi:hypothetical protein